MAGAPPAAGTGPPAPPAPPPLGATAMGAPIMPARTTFRRRFYEQCPHDVNTISRQMAPFDVSIAGAVPITPAELAQGLYDLTANAKPCTLLIAIDHPNDIARVRVYHCPMMCPMLLDVEPNEWMGNAFISHGDVFNNETNIHEFENDYLYLASNAAYNCLPADLINDFYTNNPNAQIMGPYDAAEPQVEGLRVRRCCFIPPRIAARFLDCNYTPREAWMNFSAAMLNEPIDIQQACTPLSHWLRALVTRSVANAAPPVIRNSLAAAMGHPLRRHRCDIIYRYLPDLDPNAIARHATNAVAARIGDVATQLENQRRDQQEAERSKSTPKLPSQKWPELTSYLVNLAHVDDETQLPPIWSRLANCAARESPIVIQNCVEAACNTIPNVYSDLKIVIEPAVANIVSSLQLPMVNDSSLDSGFQPFVMGQATPKASAQAAARNMIHDMAQQSGAQLSLDDVASLTTILAKDQIVTSHIDAVSLVRRFYVLAAVLFGSDHQAVREVSSFLDKYQSSLEDFLRLRQPRNPEYKGMLPTLIVRYLQVYWADWLDNQWNNNDIYPVPTFSSVFSDIKLGKVWEIPLPEEYDAVLKAVLNPTPIPSHVPGGGNSLTTTESSLTPEQEQRQKEKVTTAVENAHYKESLFGEFKSARTSAGRVIPIKIVRMNALKKKDVIPPCPKKKDIEMCVSYHVIGRCQSNCRRAIDHYPHTDEEDAPLVQFCTSHWHE